MPDDDNLTGEAEIVRPILSPDEYVALKQIAAQQKKGFWTDYPLLISLFAFLLSLTTAIISAWVSYKKDIHDQLTELSAALRTLGELNLKQIEVHEKYAGKANEVQATALLANDVYNTTMTAAEISFRVGTHATTASMIPISQNLNIYGQHTRAIQLAQIALDAAQTAPDETTALRWLATMKMNERTPQSTAEANDLFNRALNFEQKFGMMPIPAMALFLKAGVLLDWADVQAPNDCESARKHFSDGWQMVTVGGSPDLDQLRELASQKFTIGIGAIRTCLPTSTNPPLPNATATAK